MFSSMTPMHAPTDFPIDMVSASFPRACLWRRKIRTVFNTDHLTCESAFFCVKPKPLSNKSNCLGGKKVKLEIY